MSWLTPIGFLGLIGLLILIIIYIIKPNYQNKVISSTYIWKLSLKYKKKKMPLSKLRNILLFICQMLILTSAALILAQPYIDNGEEVDGAEKVIIVDASASMLSESVGKTRLEYAIDEVHKLIDELEDGKKLSVILASESAEFIVQRADNTSKEAMHAALDSILDESENTKYTYGTPDIEGAISLAEEITAYTADSEVLLYTDTTYLSAGKVKVVDVSDPSEYNVAILDVRARMVENHYIFEIDVAAYGINADVDVYVDFYGVNYEELDLNYRMPVRCSNDEVQTITFAYDEELADEFVDIYEYNYVYVHVEEDDSLDSDNTFYLYGGKRPILNVQYYSALPNNYFATALIILRDRLGDYWDIELTEVKYDETPETEGFDIYIYEHVMPSTIPNDGIVILANPDELPSYVGIQLGNSYTSSSQIPLEAGDSHPIMDNIDASTVTVTRFTEIKNYDEFTPLMCYNGKPLVMAKNEDDAKIVVMTFSLNFSNFALVNGQFPLFLYNIMNYYAPKTLNGFVYDINDNVDLNARGEQLDVVGPKTDKSYLQADLPTSLIVKNPGVYTLSQDLISDETVVENFFVKIPEEESNINLQVDELKNPYFYQEPENTDTDLLLYFAIALVALLFIEWWLKSREQI